MNQNLLPTGQIVNTHGLRGHVKVMPWADDPDELLDYERFFIDGREYRVQHSSRQKSMILLKLEGVDSIEDAARLRQKEISIAREDVELANGVAFIADLIGLPVLADGVEIGKLTEVLTLPGNDVYVVKGQREYLIPAVPQVFIQSVDLDANRMDVHILEGMASDEN